MDYRIDKQFDFCYGHRVHNQRLNEDYSLDSCLACRHLHGHQGMLKVHLELPDRGIADTGMVTDFKHLNWLKKWVDDVLDHKFIVDIGDPVIAELFSEVAVAPGQLYERRTVVHDEGYYTPNLEQLAHLDQGLFEVYEGLVIVEFVPTSENLCAWIAKVAQERMRGLGVKVACVEFNETPKSHCQIHL